MGNDTWYRISYGGKEGYIHGDYFKQMTIAELVQNRDKFAQESIKAVMSDMGNMGLEIINLTIQNFSDKDNNVIETMALQNIVDKERDAKIARAKAEQEGHKAEIEAQAIIAEQNKELEIVEINHDGEWVNVTARRK